MSQPVSITEETWKGRRDSHWTLIIFDEEGLLPEVYCTGLPYSSLRFVENDLRQRYPDRLRVTRNEKNGNTYRKKPLV